MDSKSPPALLPRMPDADCDPPAIARPRRLALWEIGDGMQCSVIGTCLSDVDLTATIRRHNLRVERGAQSYDIHSYCVRAACQNSPFSRTLTKLLDRRYGGAIRLVGRAKTDDAILVVWERLRDSGQIAAGYWAVMSHTHVADGVKVRVFGEVHMLSHLNGRGANQLALRLAEAERKYTDLEARLRRSEQAKLDAFAERDAAREALAAANARSLQTIGDTIPRQSPKESRLQYRLAKCERALISARARARHAEEMIAQLIGRSAASRQVTARPEPSPATEEAHTELAPLQQRILYLGGRAAIVPHLREAAAARAAAFLHHDGGIEDSFHRIEELIERCDAVVCPVDCVSHGACRLAKAACQRLNKRFLPISTASRSGFERALEELARLTPPSGPSSAGGQGLLP